MRTTLIKAKASRDQRALGDHGDSQAVATSDSTLRHGSNPFEDTVASVATRIACRAFNVIDRSGLGDHSGENRPTWKLLGLAESIITSNRGDRDAKLAAINPHFAGLIANWLLEAGALPGFYVAVALTGSFPGINICVHAALKACQLNAAIVTSLASSNWGANRPEYCWLDMEQQLLQAGIFDSRPQLVSLGGDGDCGGRLSPEGVSHLIARIAQLGCESLMCSNTRQSIQRRIAFYRSCSCGFPIQAYINVGGNVASISKGLKNAIPAGICRQLPPPPEGFSTYSSSVALHFIRDQTPVIHLNNIASILTRYSLPAASDWPALMQTATVGEQGVVESDGDRMRLRSFLDRIAARLGQGCFGRKDSAME